MNTIRFALIFIALASGCTTRGTLDNRIAEERREAARLELELAAASEGMPNSQDIYVALKHRRLSEWLQNNTTPIYSIRGIGLRREGDLIYAGGVGKAWIEPERDTWFDIRIERLLLSGTSAGLDAIGNISSIVAMRIRTYILNTGSNVLCNGRLNRTEIKANLTAGSPTNNTIPFSLSIASPDSIPITVECKLGKIGDYRQTFQVKDLARTVSSGNIELGWSTKGTLKVPEENSDKIYTYILTSSHPQLKTATDRFEYKADIDVSITDISFNRHP